MELSVIIFWFQGPLWLLWIVHAVLPAGPRPSCAGIALRHGAAPWAAMMVARVLWS